MLQQEANGVNKRKAYLGIHRNSVRIVYRKDNAHGKRSIKGYCINDRSGLQANDDGSVDVILSEDAPKDTTNWLPVGDGGFHLFMRIYTPDMDALETWTAPTITEIDPSNVN